MPAESVSEGAEVRTDQKEVQNVLIKKTVGKNKTKEQAIPQAPPVPNIAVPNTIVSLIGHTIYAVLLAVTYAVLKR